jgi:hypothetical protein
MPRHCTFVFPQLPTSAQVIKLFHNFFPHRQLVEARVKEGHVVKPRGRIAAQRADLLPQLVYLSVVVPLHVQERLRKAFTMLVHVMVEDVPLLAQMQLPLQRSFKALRVTRLLHVQAHSGTERRRQLRRKTLKR